MNEFINNNNNNNNNNNFPICYPGCLSTRRRHSQISKEDHGSSIFTCPAHTIDVRQGRIPGPAKWGMCELSNYVCQQRIEHPVFVPQGFVFVFVCCFLCCCYVFVCFVFLFVFLMCLCFLLCYFLFFFVFVCCCFLLLLFVFVVVVVIVVVCFFMVY